MRVRNIKPTRYLDRQPNPLTAVDTELLPPILVNHGTAFFVSIFMTKYSSYFAPVIKTVSRLRRFRLSWQSVMFCCGIEKGLHERRWM